MNKNNLKKNLNRRLQTLCRIAVRCIFGHKINSCLLTTNFSKTLTSVYSSIWIKSFTKLNIRFILSNFSNWFCRFQVSNVDKINCKDYKNYPILLMLIDLCHFLQFSKYAFKLFWKIDTQIIICGTFLTQKKLL